MKPYKSSDELFSEEDNVDLILQSALNRALGALGKGVEKGDFETGMMVKNLEVDQAVIIAENLGYFSHDELEGYLVDKKDESDDRLISDTRLCNWKIGFIISRIQEKKPKRADAII
jgi:hypothetical protein